MKHTNEEVNTLILGGILTARRLEADFWGNSDDYDCLDMVSQSGDLDLMKAQLIQYYNNKLAKDKI